MPPITRTVGTTCPICGSVRLMRVYRSAYRSAYFLIRAPRRCENCGLVFFPAERKSVRLLVGMVGAAFIACAVDLLLRLRGPADEGWAKLVVLSPLKLLIAGCTLAMGVAIIRMAVRAGTARAAELRSDT